MSAKAAISWLLISVYVYDIIKWNIIFPLSGKWVRQECVSSNRSWVREE